MQEKVSKPKNADKNGLGEYLTMNFRHFLLSCIPFWWSSDFLDNIGPSRSVCTVYVNSMIYVAFWLLQGWKWKSLQCVKVNWNNYLFVSRDLHPFVNLLPQFSTAASVVCGVVLIRPDIVNCFCALDLKLNLIFILLLGRNTWQWH